MRPTFAFPLPLGATDLAANPELLGLDPWLAPISFSCGGRMARGFRVMALASSVMRSLVKKSWFAGDGIPSSS